MIDWSLARKSGEGVQITSEAMWDDYLKWRDQQCCEKCGAKFSERPPDDEWWITETLCYRCYP